MKARFSFFDSVRVKKHFHPACPVFIYADEPVKDMQGDGYRDY